MSDNSKGSYAATPRREFEVFAAGSKRDLISCIAMIGETDRNGNHFLPKLFPVSIREMTPAGLLKNPHEVLIEPRGLTADGNSGVRWTVTGYFPKDSKMQRDGRFEMVLDTDTGSGNLIVTQL